MPEPEPFVRRHAWFSGRVQGVGFRAAAVRRANARRLAGWVRNLPNGEVELAVEGPAAAVAALFGDLSAAFGGGIAAVRVDDEPPAGEPAGFDFRR